VRARRCTSSTALKQVDNKDKIRSAEDELQATEEELAATGETEMGEEKQNQEEASGADKPDDEGQPDKDWYVIHTYSGYENKVKTNLERRVKTMEKRTNI